MNKSGAVVKQLTEGI